MHRLKPEFTAEIRTIVGEGNFREGETIAMIDYGVAPENLDAGAVVDLADHLAPRLARQQRPFVGAGAQRHVIGHHVAETRHEARQQRGAILFVEFPARHPASAHGPSTRRPADLSIRGAIWAYAS